METDEPLTILKIIYQQKGKIINLKDLTYDKLLSNLIQTFKLEVNNYYHLYFKDQQEDYITIGSHQDFQAFTKCPCPKKLYLERTNDFILHFRRWEQKETTQNQEKQLDLLRIIEAKKIQINQKVPQFESELQKKIMKEMEIKLVDYQQKLKRQISHSNTIHKNIKCSKCKGKNDIIGVRYQCIKCNYNICQGCEARDEHIHPLIKILKESQALAVKNNMLIYEDDDLRKILQQRNQRNINNKQQDNKQSKLELIKQFISKTDNSQEQALVFINKYPNKDLQTLLELYFQGQNI